MSFANVLVIVEAETILKNYGANGTADQPTYMGHENIYLTTSIADASSNNKSGWLAMNIKADTENSIDVIRWRMASTSLGFGYQCCFTEFMISAGADILTKPQQRAIPAKRFLPDETQAGNFVPNKASDMCWESRVLGTGYIQYNFNFAIIDPQGVTQGFYTYDPGIYAQ